MTTPLIGRIMACVPGYGTTVQRTTNAAGRWAAEAESERNGEGEGVEGEGEKSEK